MDKENEEHLFIAFNAKNAEELIELPIPPKDKQWRRIVDTSLDSPQDFVEEDEAEVVLEKIVVEPYSAILLKAKAQT